MKSKNKILIFFSLTLLLLLTSFVSGATHSSEFYGFYPFNNDTTTDISIYERNLNSYNVTIIDDLYRNNVANISLTSYVLDDSIDDYINLKNFSISLWFKANFTVTSAGVLSGFTDGSVVGSDHLIFLTSSGNIRFQNRIFANNNFQITTSGKYLDNTWHHVLASSGNSGAKLFVDGILIGNSTSNSSLYSIPDLDSFYIGAGKDDGDLTFFYEGLISDVVLFNSETSINDSLSIYNNDVYGYDVIPLLGQSNTVGMDNIRNNIDNNYTLIEDNFYQFGFFSQNISNATNPLDHQYVSFGTSGLWKGFSENIINSLPYKRGVLFVPAGYPGSSFSGNNWNQGDTIYTNAVNSINNALQTSSFNELTAILWHQGESDANTGTYLNDLTNMHTAFKSDINSFSDETIFITGGILDDVNNYETINNDLETFSNNNKYRGYYDASGLDDKGDNLHFSSSSLYTIGENYASLYLTLPTDIIIFPVSSKGDDVYLDNNVEEVREMVLVAGSLLSIFVLIFLFKDILSLMQPNEGATNTVLINRTTMLFIALLIIISVTAILFIFLEKLIII